MTTLLGGLTAAAFLQHHWQKRPLLVRQAIPGFAGIVDKEDLFALATRDDAISRLVVEHPRRRRERWELHKGPFVNLESARLPESHWTLLVQGVEGLREGAWELLRRFSFLPAARIDDLMISYAAAQGSVGPHIDLYDVFLLQGPGRRSWRISSRRDHALDASAPFKMLKDFVAEEEFILESGDMLYLPPGVAHWGVALEPCFTYSIGFVAPSQEALLQNFLAYLGQCLEPVIDPESMYEDPDLKPQRNPLAIGDAMVQSVERMLQAIPFDRPHVEEFLGGLLTGPKPHVVFHPPARPLPASAFNRRLAGRGRIALALPSRGLVRASNVFLNGEMHAVDNKTLRMFEELVTARSVALPLSLGDRGTALLYHWYEAGYLGIVGSNARSKGKDNNRDNSR